MKQLLLALLLTMFFAASTQASVGKPIEQEHYRQEALDLLRQAISFRSIGGSSELRPMLQMWAQWFRNHGFAPADVHYLEMDPGLTGLVVRYRGDGSGGKPILLMAHLDVVDALREDWNSDPFTLLQKNGYLYGRGTMDNKTGAVSLSTTFMRLRAAGYVPSRDLIIVFSSDEETTSYSIRAILEQHRDLVDAEFALNTDAGGGYQNEHGAVFEFKLQAAEKTYMDFELTVTNSGGHSSRPKSDNAIYRLSDALQKLQAFRFPVRINDITRGYFAAGAKQEQGELATAMARFAENPDDDWAQEVLWNIPTKVGYTRTTCIPTLLKAGHAPNAQPQLARANVNCRVFPGESVADTLRVLTAVIDDPKVEIAVQGDPRSSPASPLAPAIIDTVQQSGEQPLPRRAGHTGYVCGGHRWG